MESSFIEILLPDKSSCIVSAVYKQPPMKPYSFINTSFWPLPQKIKKRKQKKNNLNRWLYLQSFKLYMLKILEPMKFLESIFSNNFTPQINLPTRIGTSSTLIDNILINSQQNVYTSGNLTTSISYHLPQFIIIENLFKWYISKKDIKILKRDFSKFHSDNFIRDFKSVN